MEVLAKLFCAYFFRLVLFAQEYQCKCLCEIHLLRLTNISTINSIILLLSKASNCFLLSLDDWDRRLCKAYLEEYMHPDQLDGELMLAPGFPTPPNMDYQVWFCSFYYN